MMTKEAVVRPGITPDTEERLPKGEKAASTSHREQTELLDDDITKKAANAAATRLVKR